MYRRLCGPQGRSVQVRKISPSQEFDPLTVQPVASRYTDYATRPTMYKVKVKCIVVQALRLWTGCTAHRGSRGLAVIFHGHGTRRGWGISVTPRPLFTPGKTRYPLYRRLSGPQGRSVQVRKISHSQEFDPRTVQPVASRYTGYATRPTNIHCSVLNSLSVTSIMFCALAVCKTTEQHHGTLCCCTPNLLHRNATTCGRTHFDRPTDA